MTRALSKVFFTPIFPKLQALFGPKLLEEISLLIFFFIFAFLTGVSFFSAVFDRSFFDWGQ